MLLSPFHIQGHETWERLMCLAQDQAEEKGRQSQKLELNCPTQIPMLSTLALDLQTKEKIGRATTGGLLPEVDLPEIPQEKYRKNISKLLQAAYLCSSEGKVMGTYHGPDAGWASADSVLP